MTTPAPRSARPILAAALLGLLSEAVFLLNLARPHKLVFDEVHYVPAARAMLALAKPVNVEHPLLGKELIAAGMLLFGDTSFGWRFSATIAGAVTVMGLFAITYLLTGRTRPAVIASLLALLNFLLFIQARIAMLDVFEGAFVMPGLACLFWARVAPTPRAAWRRWIAGGVLLGLAVACKWSAAPFLIYAALGLLVVRARDARGLDMQALLTGKDQATWRGIPTHWGILALAGVSIAAYFLTFLPAFFYAEQPLTLGSLIPFQFEMLAQQTQVLPHHPYESNWTTWPFIVRPIWYLYEQADGAQRGILMLGNPVVMWGGLVAIVALLWAWLRTSSLRLLVAAALWIGAYGMWAMIPKSLGFYYYYYIPALFLPVAIAVAFDHWRARHGHWDESFVIVAAGMAFYFWPIISAAALGDPQAFQRWMWFSTWP